MRTIVLDSGAFLAFERWDRQMIELLATADENNDLVVIPAAVVAECWRRPARAQAAKLLLGANEVAALTERRARSVGELLGDAGIAHIADGSVADLAIEHIPSLVLTSDVADIERLIRAGGVECTTGTAAAAPVRIQHV
jgi:hypothetical protein